MSALLDSLAEIGAKARPGRRKEFEQAAALGLPGQRSERWKYTSLRALATRRFRDGHGSADDFADESILQGIEGARIVFINGDFSARLTNLDPPTGLTLFGYTCTDDVPDETYDSAEDVFSSLNRALELGGAVIDVEVDARVEAPVHIVFVGTSAGTDIASHLRHRIRVGAGAGLTLVEHHIGATDNRNLDNHVVEVEVGSGARVLHARIQDASGGATLIARTDVRVAEGAQYRRVDLELGASLSRHELNVDLNGRGARFQSSGALLAGGRRHVDTRLGVRHVVGETACELLWRGLAAERGKVSFHGGIEIEAGADGSDASLSNKNLLLSPNAEIDTQPVLLIHADEVKAAHGATVGRLDERSLFYLRSRGIPAAQARVMLTLAFLREVLAAANAPALVEALAPRLEARLATLETLEALA